MSAPIDECLHLPCVGNECWNRYDGLTIRARVTHRTKAYFCTVNTEAFVDSQGRLVPAGELQSIPPGHPNSQFRLYVEGQPAPEWNDRAKRWKDTPPKMTPLF